MAEPRRARWRLPAATPGRAPAALWLQPDTSPPAPASVSPAGWADWCAAHAGRRCRLWLSAALLHELTPDPALALGDDAALLAYARPLLQHYHGEAAARWPLAVWRSGGWPAPPQRGVSALHGVDPAALQATARRHRVQLLGLRPGWAAALGWALSRCPALARAAQAWLLVVEGPRLTQLQCCDGQLAQVLQRRLPLAGAASAGAAAAASAGAAASTVGATASAAEAAALWAWWSAQPAAATAPAWVTGLRPDPATVTAAPAAPATLHWLDDPDGAAAPSCWLAEAV